MDDTGAKADLGSHLSFFIQKKLVVANLFSILFSARVRALSLSWGAS